MDALQHSLATTGGPLLVAGCAMIALGASAVVTAVLWWSRRRRPSSPPPEPAKVVVDRYDAPAAVVSVPNFDRRHLQHIDRRLEDLEAQIVALADRVDTVLRPRPEAETPSRPKRRAVEPAVTETPPTAEELQLRALVARGN